MAPERALEREDAQPMAMEKVQTRGREREWHPLLRWSHHQAKVVQAKHSDLHLSKRQLEGRARCRLLLLLRGINP